jgi:hypothetical protein
MQARGGRPGGNILDLVALMDGCSVREAALHLQDWRGTLPPRLPIIAASPAVEPNAPLRFRLHHIDGRHPYLADRDLTSETVSTFGVGFYHGRGFLHGRVVIPIHNERGELIAYAGRAIGTEEPKYRFPAGFRKSRVLFNLHRASATGGRDVMVVEGFFDAVAVHQAGYPSVVALMGSTLSPCQADLLTSRFDRVIVMLDGDDAGRQGSRVIETVLTARMPVTMIALGDAMQPDQLTSGEIQRLLREHM